jgi:hypothetical protein
LIIYCTKWYLTYFFASLRENGRGRLDTTLDKEIIYLKSNRAIPKPKAGRGAARKIIKIRK